MHTGGEDKEEGCASVRESHYLTLCVRACVCVYQLMEGGGVGGMLGVEYVRQWS
jgi:hypothetical protein